MPCAALDTTAPAQSVAASPRTGDRLSATRIHASAASLAAKMGPSSARPARRRPAAPMPRSWRCGPRRPAGHRRARRDGVGHARTLRPPWSHAALLRRADRGRHGARRRRDRRPVAPRRRGGCVANARGRHRGRTVCEHDLETAAREVNIGFFSRIERGRPWMRLKVATSLDGVTALRERRQPVDHRRGRSRRRPCLAPPRRGRADRHRHGAGRRSASRRAACAHVDAAACGSSSTRILRIAGIARLLDPPGACSSPAPTDPAQRADSIRTDEGPRSACCQPGPVRSTWFALVDELARREVNELHVEAGPRLNAALLQAGLVDELLVYHGPAPAGPGTDPSPRSTPSRT